MVSHDGQLCRTAARVALALVELSSFLVLVVRAVVDSELVVDLFGAVDVVLIVLEVVTLTVLA
jgi:hypothetical protein